MSEQELKDKIVEVIENTEFVTGYYPEDVVNIKQRPTYSLHSSLTNYVTTLSFDFACVLTDALIAAGLKFDENYSFTAAFNSVQAEQKSELERRLTAAEHRAEVAEKALYVAALKVKTLEAQDPIAAEYLAKNFYIPYLIKQAEKELEEEGKE